MTWSESGYANEQTDKPQNKLEGQSDKVYNTTDFLSKFEGNQNTIVSACMQEIQSDTQLKEGFDNLLKSGISNDLINKIKQELEEGIKFGIDDVTLKDSIQGIIAENIENFKIGSMAFEGTLRQMNQEEEKTVQEEEKAVQEEEKAVQEEEKAVQEEEKAVQEEEKADNSTEQAEDWGKMNKEMLKKCSDYREQLLVGHEKLDQKIKNEAKNIKDNLNIDELTKQKREQNGIDENFIDNYILVKVTLNEVKKDSSFDVTKIQEFEGLVGDLDNGLKLSNRDILLKSIDNACNIPDTSLSSFSTENIAQTRTELFNEDSGVGNESLKTARDNNMDSHKEVYGEIFPEMGDDEVVAKYGKFLEGDLKAFWQQYESNRDVIKNKIAEIGIMIKNQQIFGENGENYLSDEEKILWNNYKKMLSVTNEIRKETEEQTKNLMEEMCIISQIKGMYMCMGEGDDFNLNKANEIRYDEQGAMILDGHVDGVAFSIRQDINNPEAKLQTSQKLARSADGNVFSIGGTDNFVDSNFILPSQNKIFESIVATVQSDKSLENYDNQDEYLENLQKNIIGTMEKIYKDTEYVHHYMQGQVSGENIINETMNLISEKCPNITNDEESLKNINQNENKDKDLFDFFKILKFNIDNSTNTEKDHLNQCVLKILEITNNYANNNGKESSISFKYPPIIENFLKNENWLTGGNENSRLSSLSELFKYYSEKSADARSNSEGTGNSGISSKMIINDLYIDLFESNNGKNLSQTAELYNGEKQKEEEKKQYEENRKQYEEKEEQDKNEAYSKLMEQWPPED